VSDFDELVAHPGVGRMYEQAVTAGLADAAPGGRVRLDALARWLQDAALADVVDAGLGETAVWVVRRARMEVVRFPRFGEAVTLQTFSSGVGRMWAQRRTTVTSADGGLVEAVALWVHLDPETGRPMPLTEQELVVYGPSTAGRQVKARLRHPTPPAHAAARPWAFRRTEVDVADHINNAAYWAPLEEELLEGAELVGIDVEIEHRSPAQPGPHEVRADDAHRWLVDTAGEVRASFRLGRLDREN
jgi:acyl-ACP thioesterase